MLTRSDASLSPGNLTPQTFSHHHPLHLLAVQTLHQKKHDLLVIRTLRKTGWTVLRIWEHELIRKNHPRLLRRIQRALI
jgi:hypothetical protein